GRYLQSNIGSLSEFSKNVSMPAYQDALLSILKATIHSRGSADAAASYKTMLGLLVFSEVITDSPDLANFVARSVGSTKDLERWLAFMALPANGWVFFDPPTPRVE